jgi:hypothetical protein
MDVVNRRALLILLVERQHQDSLGPGGDAGFKKVRNLFPPLSVFRW